MISSRYTFKNQDSVVVKNQKLVLIASLLFAGQILLEIVFENLPYPLNTFAIYFFVLILVLIFSNIFLLTNRSYLPICFFIGFYFILFVSGIYGNKNEYTMEWLLVDEVFPLFIAVLFFTIWMRTDTLKYLAVFIKYVLLFIFITSVTSIVGLTLYPSAARDLGGALGLKDDFTTIRVYKSLGIATYGFFYGIAFTMSSIVYLLKSHWNQPKYRFLFIIYIIVVYYAIIKSQLTAALLIASISIVLSIPNLRKQNTNLIVLFIVLILFIAVPIDFYANIIFSIAEMVPGEVLKSRIHDLAISLKFISSGIEAGGEHYASRFARILLLLGEFIKNPIFGGDFSTAHVFWLDRLSLFGIVGMIPWVIFLTSIIKKTIALIHEDLRNHYAISIISLVFIGFLKGIGGVSMYFFVFFFGPAILYVYSNNKNIFDKSNGEEKNI
jgi:hypothetical protein